MKHLLLVGCLLFSVQSRSQTTAADWTLTDCAGNSHNLFGYLDSGQVVIMEFAMGCAGCYDAAPPLIDKTNEYAISHPGKVKAFYMDYWTGNDCVTEILPMVGMYDFDGIISHCNTEKSYYFGSSVPMPGIVIAAGPFHEIIYQSITFMEGDTLPIQQAIDSFFMTVSIKETLLKINPVKLYPNPATHTITLEMENAEGLYFISLFDITGKLIGKMSCDFSPSNKSKQMDVSTYPKGIYNMKITNGETLISQKLLIE